MKLKIDSITKSKDASEECVRLEVLSDTNLSGYGLIAEIREAGSDKVLLHFLKFSDCQARKGDLVRVFSGFGEAGSSDNLVQTTTHVFYWNTQSSLWGAGSGNIELVKIKDTSGQVMFGE